MGVFSRFVLFGVRKCTPLINLLGPETARWFRVFHAKGWWPKNSWPPSKVRLPWVFEEKNLRCPGNFAGMSRTPAGAQKSEKSSRP